MGVNASIEGSNPSFSASLDRRFPLRGGEVGPTATGNTGSRLPPHHPAWETRLRHSEAGFVFSEPFRVASVGTPINVWDYEQVAQDVLDANALAYFAGGSGDEVTLRDNLAAFERRRLRPRVLVDVREVSTATTVLGTDVALPILVAPLAMQRLAHPDGEVATARAAAAAG